MFRGGCWEGGSQHGENGCEIMWAVYLCVYPFRTSYTGAFDQLKAAGYESESDADSKEWRKWPWAIFATPVATPVATPLAAF